jgi:hypothetical protein
MWLPLPYCGASTVSRFAKRQRLHKSAISAVELSTFTYRLPVRYGHGRTLCKVVCAFLPKRLPFLGQWGTAYGYHALQELLKQAPTSGVW